MPGTPLFSFGAYSILIDDEIPGIEVHAAIFRRSLIFQQHSQGYFSADIIYSFEIVPEDSDVPIYNREFSSEIITNGYKSTRNGTVERLKQTIPLSPGTYTITMRVIDQRSKQVSTLSEKLEIPTLSEDTLTSLILSGRDEARNIQEMALINYQVPSGVDSLKVRTHVQAGIEGINQLSVVLLRFPADTLPASPPHHFNSLEGTLDRHGINYLKPDTIYTSSRDLRGFFGGIGVEFQLPNVTRGVYRISLESHNDTLLISQKSRDFAITDKQFPLVTNIKTLAEATIYLHSGAETKLSGRLPSTPDSIKHALDLFWAEFGENTYRARSIISGYYSRVEEANLMFSTYKEGWKTDPGMVYILFGPPSNIERNPGGMSWYYPTRQSEYPLVFYFDRMFNSDGPLPGANFVLKRHFQYERWLYDQLWKWRSGVF